MVGQQLLGEASRGKTLPDMLMRAFERSQFPGRFQSLAQNLRREADLLVLRGLFALEVGDGDEAEVAFRVALALWRDEAAAASGAGIDFTARPVAQGYLKLLE
jgi:hypothetical protein